MRIVLSRINDFMSVGQIVKYSKIDFEMTTTPSCFQLSLLGFGGCLLIIQTRGINIQLEVIICFQGKCLANCFFVCNYICNSFGFNKLIKR